MLLYHQNDENYFVYELDIEPSWFRGTAMDHFHFQAFLSWTYSAESSVGFGRREKGTQHAAKLHFSVFLKSRTYFLKTYLQGF